MFCAAFAVLPGEWQQRWLFYVGIPITVPAVLDAWRRLAGGALFWTLAAFLAYSGVSALWSDHWLSVGDEMRRAFWIGYFLLACCAVGAQGPAVWRSVLIGVQMLGAIWAVVAVATFAAQCPGCERFVGFGAHANANYTASVAATMALLGLAAILSDPRRRMLWLLPAQIPLLALLAVAGGRAAMIGYAAAATLGVVLTACRAGVGRAVLAMGATIGGIAAFAIAAHWLAAEWMATEIGRGDTFRLRIWAANAERILQRPWFGHGSNTADEFALNGVVIGYHAHNLFLAQAFYGGILGLALWVTVFALAGRTAWRAWRDSGDVLPACALLLLCAIGTVDIGYVVVDVQAIWFYVWLVLGVVLSYDLAARRPAPTAA